MTGLSIADGFDFTDPDLYQQRIPWREFAELRRTAPIWWNRKSPEVGGFPDDGFWVVTRHADIKQMSLNSADYSSWENTCVIRFSDDITRELIESQRVLLMNSDGPNHDRLRRIVQKSFSPQAIRQLREETERMARQVVLDAAAQGTGDFVADVAFKFPVLVIAEMLGLPLADCGKICNWVDQMAYSDEPGLAGALQAATEIIQYSLALAKERRRRPMDDIITKLVHAGAAGESLTADEFCFFVIQLVNAGGINSRQAISLGMQAFLDHPEQWEAFKRQRPAVATEEILRWTTPTIVLQRTATRDTEIGGVGIRKGQRLGMFYASANFDEEVFDNPYLFNIFRDPNPHLAFGGGGLHYCLGAGLARLEIDLIFNTIADHLPSIKELAPPPRLRSGWLNGLKEYQVKY